MVRERLAEQLQRLAPLAEPVRRALYLHVVRAGADVGREEAARAVGVSRSLAAFHLDRLLEAGLLEAGYRRLSGRRGPGAGRPAKVYRRATADLRVSVPERDYELATRLLVAALVERAGSAPVALRRAAREAGTTLGHDARGRAGHRSRRRRNHSDLVALLEERGFRPVDDGGRILLRNCPFDALAAEHPDTVCRMNLALLEGIVQGLRHPRLRPELDPRPGRCCVVLAPA